MLCHQKNFKPGIFFGLRGVTPPWLEIRHFRNGPPLLWDFLPCPHVYCGLPCTMDLVPHLTLPPNPIVPHLGPEPRPPNSANSLRISDYCIRIRILTWRNGKIWTLCWVKSCSFWCQSIFLHSFWTLWTLAHNSWIPGQWPSTLERLLSIQPFLEGLESFFLRIFQWHPNRRHL